jgi:hypothetical protein
MLDPQSLLIFAAALALAAGSPGPSSRRWSRAC